MDHKNIPYIIIDTDVGDDDLGATLILLVAHARNQLKIVGITTINGIMTAKEGEAMMKSILETLGILDIPVFRGKEHRIKNDSSAANHNFSEADWWNGSHHALLTSIPQKMKLSPLNDNTAAEPKEDGIEAIDFLISSSKSFENRRLIILALGPFCNITAVLSKEPEFLQRLESIVFMGGNITAPGNTPNHVSEWNFYCDATSFAQFLQFLHQLQQKKQTNNHLRVPKIVMCGLEVANVEAVARVDQLKLLQIPSEPSKIVSMLQSLVEITEYALSYDPVASAFLLNEDIFECKGMNLKILEQKPYEGKMIEAPLEDKDSAVLQVAVTLNKQGYFDLLTDIFRH